MKREMSLLRALLLGSVLCVPLHTSGCKKATKGGAGAGGSGAASGGSGAAGSGRTAIKSGGGSATGASGVASKGPDSNADVGYDDKKPVDPVRMPKADEPPPAEVSARVILVKYITANDPGDAKRSKSAASERATLLMKRARQKDADFVALAQKFSDADEAKDRVYEVGPKSKLAFAKAAMGLGVGQVANPVASRFGFYVVMRIAPQEVSTAHIQFVYKGATLAPTAFKRSKKDAKKRAEKVLKKALDGGSFSVLAATYSDSPSKMRGGVIRPLTEERVNNKYAKGFDAYFKAALATEVGKVHDKVVETPYGFHIIKRLPLKKILAQHILVVFKGSAAKAAATTTRDKEAARALARKLRLKVLRKKQSFEDLARKYSEDSVSAAKGGTLPPFARGEMVPKFEQFAFALKPGAISDVVESRMGFHIIKRLR